MSSFVETLELTKKYGEFSALSACSLSIEQGEVYGLLGPNGAGKTTLIRLLLGFLRPTHGRATVAGLDCFRQSVAVRSRISYLPAEAKLFRRMRGDDVLRFFADIRGTHGNLKRSMQLATRLDLDLQRRVAFMSTGMRQKLALAATLAHEAPLLILDEPTANLDPNVRAEVMRILAELNQDGRTIILSSHVLSEIEEACDRVVILRGGRLVHTQSMNELRQRHRVSARAPESMQSPPAELARRVRVEHYAGRIIVETEGELADVLPWVSSLGLKELTIEPYGLRSVYEQYHSGEELP
ncbi:MAG: ABC transporter ATP-binding protein [Planctomycetales bacterium]|nr:ABC transporter ATP-binding protein [Planctomycetales bacterium]